MPVAGRPPPAAGASAGSTSEAAQDRPPRLTAYAIGKFDALHLGHFALVAEAAPPPPPHRKGRPPAPGPIPPWPRGPPATTGRACWASTAWRRSSAGPRAS